MTTRVVNQKSRCRRTDASGSNAQSPAASEDEIAINLNGKKLASPIDIASTADPRDPIPWRQVHHWNLMRGIAHVELKKGLGVLTLRILTEGHMNLAYLDFKPEK